jgi:hypothetical protein
VDVSCHGGIVAERATTGRNVGCRGSGRKEDNDTVQPGSNSSFATSSSEDALASDRRERAVHREREAFPGILAADFCEDVWNGKAVRCCQKRPILRTPGEASGGETKRCYSNAGIPVRS